MSQRQPLVLVGGQQQQLQSADYLNTGIPYWMHKNRLLNGDFNVWQRGTALNTITTSGTYYPDQWVYTFDGTSPSINVQQEAFAAGQTSVPDNPKYYCECSLSVAASGQTFLRKSQRIEGVQTFQGQSATISFWAKADTARSLSVAINQNFGAGGSSTVSTSGTTFSLTTTWTKYSYTFSVPSISGKTVGVGDYLELVFGLPINSGFTIDISHVQFESGSNATQFEYRHIEHELLMCQRYFEPVTSTGGFLLFGFGFNVNSTTGRVYIAYLTKRTVPTVSFDVASHFTLSDDLGNHSVSALSNGGATARQIWLSITSTGLSAGSGCQLLDNNTAAFIYLSAEL